MNIFKKWYYKLRLRYLKWEIKRVKQQYNFIGSKKRPYKNHRMFGIDPNGDIYEVPTINKKTAFINPEHRYIWALNKESVIKKIKKLT